ILFYACEEVDNNLKSTDQKETTEYFVKEGILYFQDGQAVSSYLDKVGNLTDEQLTSMENSMEYVSLYREIDKAYEDLNKASSKSEFKKLINNLNDIFELSEGQYIVPKISDPGYQKLVNRTGVYYVNNKMYKIKDNVLASSLNNKSEYELEDAITSYNSSGRKNKFSQDSLMLTLVGSREDRSSLTSLLVAPIDDGGGSGGSGGSGGGSNANNYPGVTNCNYVNYPHSKLIRNIYTGDDRQLHFDIGASSYLLEYTGSTTEMRRPVVSFGASGWKKGLFGGWNRYKTFLEIEDIEVEVTYEGKKKTFWWVRAYTGSDSEVIQISEKLGPDYERDSRYGTLKPVTLHKAKGRASSRGIGANWAIIDCSF
ncbi:hypothetical protein C9994_07955, partial [Marivirga lumbricoides]